jgi:hypothetical protein
MRPPALPFELVHMVLFYLPGKVSADLKRCSLVNKLWRREAQRVLFNTQFVRVDMANWWNARESHGRSSYRFVELMDASPQLRSLVHNVRLDLTHIGADTSPIRERTMIDFFLPLFNSGVKELRELWICVSNYSHKDIHLPLSVKLEPRLCSLFRSVTSLVFQGVVGVQNLISLQLLLLSCRNLQEFSFPWIYYHQYYSPDQVPTSLALHSLTITDHDLEARNVSNGALFQWLFRTNTVHTIRNIILKDYWGTNVSNFIKVLSGPWSLDIDGELRELIHCS